MVTQIAYQDTPNLEGIGFWMYYSAKIAGLVYMGVCWKEGTPLTNVSIRIHLNKHPRSRTAATRWAFWGVSQRTCRNGDFTRGRCGTTDKERLISNSVCLPVFLHCHYIIYLYWKSVLHVSVGKKHIKIRYVFLFVLCFPGMSIV